MLSSLFTKGALSCDFKHYDITIMLGRIPVISDSICSLTTKPGALQRDEGRRWNDTWQEIEWIERTARPQGMEQGGHNITALQLFLQEISDLESWVWSDLDILLPVFKKHADLLISTIWKLIVFRTSIVLLKSLHFVWSQPSASALVSASWNLRGSGPITTQTWAETWQATLNAMKQMQS